MMPLEPAQCPLGSTGQRGSGLMGGGGGLTVTQKITVITTSEVP